MPVQQCQTGKQPILLILSLANLRPADENPQTKKINMFHMHTYNPSPQHLVHPCCGLAPAPSKSAVMKSSPSAFHILNWLQLHLLQDWIFYIVDPPPFVSHHILPFLR